ncbi:MAG: hypothetical protein FJW32_24690 [Acidobacteria bacterium]|nr:hypothetical protein [Acidobacteriota bacterium]
METYLASIQTYHAFLTDVSEGRFPRTHWNHAAHLAMASSDIARGGGIDEVRAAILSYNETQGIVSTPDSGYHETVTRFWCDRLAELLVGLGRGATAYDLARAAVAGLAHRREIFKGYYSFDVFRSRQARAEYVPPDLG